MNVARLTRFTTPLLSLALLLAVWFLFSENRSAAQESRGFALSFTEDSTAALLVNHSTSGVFRVRFSCDGAELATTRESVASGARVTLSFPMGRVSCGQSCTTISATAFPEGAEAAALTIYRK